MEFKVGDRVRFIENSMLHEGIIIENCGRWAGYLYDNYLVKSMIGEFNILAPSLVLDNCINETKFKDLEQRIEKLEKEVFKPVEFDVRPEETKPSLLTEDERVILRSIPKKYNWIVRDKDWDLYLFEERPFQNEKDSNYWYSNKVCDGEYFGLFFNSMFMGIERDILYNIEELLKGEYDNEQ